MLIRFNNTVTEVDTVEYIDKSVPAEYCDNVELEGYSEPTLNYAINKDYINITHIRIKRVTSPNIYDPIGKYVAVFDANKKITVKGLSFKRNNEEVHFLECKEDVSKAILNKLLNTNYVDLSLRDVCGNK